MRWNMRLAAANRGIWKASELQHLLAERGLLISAGKMSYLWFGQPVSLKLDDLDVVCAVFGCEIGELLTPEPDKVPQPVRDEQADAAAASAAQPMRVVPRRRDGRSLPPA
jgi:DNA-binding Xre family transcriptional regulator